MSRKATAARRLVGRLEILPRSREAEVPEEPFIGDLTGSGSDIPHPVLNASGKTATFGKAAQSIVANLATGGSWLNSKPPDIVLARSGRFEALWLRFQPRRPKMGRLLPGNLNAWLRAPAAAPP